MARTPNKDAKFFPGGRADGNRGDEGWGRKTAKRESQASLALSLDERNLATILDRVSKSIIFGGDDHKTKVSVLSALCDQQGEIHSFSSATDEEYRSYTDNTKAYLEKIGIPVVQQLPPKQFDGTDQYEIRYLADAKTVVDFLRRPEVAALMNKFKDYEKKLIEKNPEQTKPITNSPLLLDSSARSKIVRAAGIACRAAGEELIDFYPAKQIQK